jgi:hypothetical protein
MDVRARSFRLDHCKRSRELGAGAHHTRLRLNNQLQGYARGLHAPKHDSYAHVSAGAVPLDSVPVWSVAAQRAKNAKELMIEHGTPKSEFVKLVYDVYLSRKLTEELLISMIENLWKIAVITKEEDARLSGAGLRSKLGIARSQMGRRRHRILKPEALTLALVSRLRTAS